MFGIVLKSNWPTNPVPVNERRAADTFQDGMAVDPDTEITNWAKGEIVQRRELQVRSTKTNRLRDAIVVERA